MRRRLSLALLIPQPVATEVQGLRRALGDPTIDRYVPHMTLVPPVNVNESRLEEALALVRKVAARHDAFELTLGPLGTFLPRNPVTYLEVIPAQAGIRELEAIQRELSVDPFHLENTRAFVPHVTIGRNETDVTQTLTYETKVTIDRVHVMQRRDDGSWFPIADVPFGEPAIVGRGGVELELTVSQLADPTTVVLVGHRNSDLVVTARHASKTAGVAVATFDGTRVNLDALVVDREMRGQGIGSQVLAQLIHECRLRNMREVITECTRADSVFEARGFTRVPESDPPMLRLAL